MPTLPIDVQNKGAHEQAFTRIASGEAQSCSARLLERRWSEQQKTITKPFELSFA